MSPFSGLFDNIFIGAGTLAGKLIGIIVVTGLIVLQFAIWMHLNGILCFLAYLGEIILYSLYIWWMRQPPTAAELQKMVDDELNENFESIEHRNAVMELNASVKRAEMNERKRK